MLRLVLVSALGLWLIASRCSAAELPEADWIWAGDTGADVEPSGSAFLRTRFALAAAPKSARIEVAADNEFELYVNGRRLGKGNSWQELRRYDVTSRLVAGGNVVCIVGGNGGGPAGVAARVIVENADGTTVAHSTGKSWKGRSKGQIGWLTVDFDDDRWPAAHVYGPLGSTPPWGEPTTVVDVASPAVTNRKPRPAPSKDSNGPVIELVDGDRVVFLGDTFIERMQQNDYVETLISIGYPDRDITFRNLGWSGDNPFGESRAGFGTVSDGFDQLRQQVFAARPSVLFISYGGSAALSDITVEAFAESLERLLDEIEPTHADVVLMTPMPMFMVRKPIRRFNETVAAQLLRRKEISAAITAVARSRDCRVLDLFSMANDPRVMKIFADRGWTENGIHFNDGGYQYLAGLIAQQLVPDLDGPALIRLSLDGRLPSPFAESLTALRTVILRKNEQFFHRWRPQNETYLFGFRKHEQGQNSAEIPQFDPLIEEAEKQIAELKKQAAADWNAGRPARKP
jgi:lysophospholipase L1-like esterase